MPQAPAQVFEAADVVRVVDVDIRLGLDAEQL